MFIPSPPYSPKRSDHPLFYVYPFMFRVEVVLISTFVTRQPEWLGTGHAKTLMCCAIGDSLDLPHDRDGIILGFTGI